MKRKCTECEYLTQTGTTAIGIHNSYSKRIYGCGYNGNAKFNYIGKSNDMSTGLTTMKTSPKWCPKENDNLVKGIIFEDDINRG